MSLTKQRTLVDIFRWFIFKLRVNPLALLQQPTLLTNAQSEQFNLDIMMAVDDPMVLLAEYRENLSLEKILANHPGILDHKVIAFIDHKLAERVEILLEQIRKDPYKNLKRFDQFGNAKAAHKCALSEVLNPCFMADAIERIKNMPLLHMPNGLNQLKARTVMEDIRKLCFVSLATDADPNSYAQYYLKEWIAQSIETILSAKPDQRIRFDDIPKIPFRATPGNASVAARLTYN